jgi:site-specific DNA-methyltransferase (adenine-specific)
MLNQITLGDCYNLLKELPNNSVDAIVTDPPYNEVNRETGGIRNYDMGVADSALVDIPFLAGEFVRLARGSIYVWCGTEQVSEWRKKFVELGLSTRVGVWVKSNPAPINGEHLWLSGLELCVFARKPNAYFSLHCKNPVWTGPSELYPGFPCPKPLWLFKTLIRASVPPNGLILDPFTGSGTSAIAAIDTGRNFICFEKDKDYWKLANKRLTLAQMQGRFEEMVG